MNVRARLTLWHTGLLGLFVTAFAVASLALLRRMELGRIDRTLHEQSEIVTQAMTSAGFRTDVANSVAAGRVVTALHDLRARGIRAWICDGSGVPVVSTAEVREGEGPEEEQTVLGDSVPTNTVIRAARAGRNDVLVTTIGGGRDGVRLVASPLTGELGSGTIVLSYSLHDVAGLLTEAGNAAVVAVLLALMASGVAGYVLARNSMAPVAEMSAQADRIGATNLHERIAARNARDELGLLGATLNRLLDRVSNTIDQQRRFMADASHELRTPVAILRGEADVALRIEGRSGAEYREALVVVRDAAERLSRTVNDIFLLARADASQVKTTPVALYLGDLVTETCRAMRSLADARGISITCEIADEGLYVGDEQLLGCVMTNLLDNAIKYSPNRSVVDIRFGRAKDCFVLQVSNTGPGIPPEARDHVFERFFRGDSARTSRVSDDESVRGSGLGLAIARWIAEAHGGALALTDATALRTTFALTLPLQPVLEPARQGG